MFILLGIILLLAVSMSIGYFIYTLQYAEQNQQQLAKQNTNTVNNLMQR